MFAHLRFDYRGDRFLGQAGDVDFLARKLLDAHLQVAVQL